ncbi:MAG TPA: alpha-L-rhamnosidase C-terminal domain-containing protein, partial [Blastococcus sp.]
PDADDPGYGTVVLAPVPGGGLTSARARIRTPYGPAGSSWTLTDGALTVDIEIAPGARGRFVVPPGDWSARHGNEPVDLGGLPISRPHGRPAMALVPGRHRIVLVPVEKAAGSG